MPEYVDPHGANRLAMANARAAQEVQEAVLVEAPEGMVKALIDPGTREIIGAHAVGADATEIIHELLLARTAELLPADVADMIHAHPTLSETVMELMRAAEGRAIHV